MTNTEGGTDDEEFRVAAIKDRVDTTMQVWMGLTIGCAKCHSHKYDPITQEEYYRFYAIFNQTADTDQPDERPTIPAPTPEIAAQRSAPASMPGSPRSRPKAAGSHDQGEAAARRARGREGQGRDRGAGEVPTQGPERAGDGRAAGEPAADDPPAAQGELPRPRRSGRAGRARGAASLAGRGRRRTD